MLFPLFLLSLLQLLVLPGLLLHRLLGLRLRGLEWAVGIAVLSLIGNYVLMHGLMVAPLLGTVHLPWIVAAEAVALGIAYRDRLRDTVRVPLLGLGLTLVGLALLAWLVSPDLPSVFTSNDAVRSWNRWALSWAADEAPQRTVMYPQLVPTLYVVVYLLTGDPTLQVLSKPVAIAFPALILVTCAAQAERGRLITAAVATVVALRLMFLLRKGFVNGDADVPAGAFGAGSHRLRLEGPRRRRPVRCGAQEAPRMARRGRRRHCGGDEAGRPSTRPSRSRPSSRGGRWTTWCGVSFHPCRSAWIGCEGRRPVRHTPRRLLCGRGARDRARGAGVRL
jgi:hypothetical protein